jgi:uncharacterized protein YkwD
MKYVALNSNVTLATYIHNANSYPLGYSVIYSIVNSSGYTELVRQVQGQLPSAGNDTATVSWIPESLGVYAVNAFVIGSSGTPTLLMPKWTATVSVIEKNKSSLNTLTPTISARGDVGQAGEYSASGTSVTTQPLPSLAQLKEYALKKINEDRANFTSPPLKLSNNSAAQAQAEEMLKTKTLSHWSYNGMKPYMLYTIMGGRAYMAQNVAGSSPSNSSDTTAMCNGTVSLPCVVTANDLYRQIDISEYNLMYNDGDCCENLHRNNLVDPFHTDVSIGIAYDNYSFYIVQNFENNYIVFDRPITTDNKTITMSGKTVSGVLSQVLIYYDELPTHQLYLQNRDQPTYDPGEFVGGVVPDSSQYADASTINATEWQSAGSTVYLSFDMSPLMIKPGVYTIYAFFDDNSNHRFVVTSYSVFHQ